MAQDSVFLNYSKSLCREGAPRFPSYHNQLRRQDRYLHLYGAEPGTCEFLNAMLNNTQKATLYDISSLLKQITRDKDLKNTQVI